jgi:hypothetical protein|tara:strand:+ start:8745 stop:9362 length:618 start_codon:yes stop_codon:yes gene_type:complete
MDELEPILLLVTSGLLLRFALTITGQAWAKSHAQTVTFLVLPVITYVITKTISGNIALSLGMIGALSIVRFRHPVKSALELVIYFALITIGIATSVRTKWAIQLIICTILIILIVKGIQILSKKIGKSFYNVSFNEGNVSNTLEVISKKRVEAIEKSDNLVNYISDINSQQYIYRLNFTNRKSLEDFRDGLAKEKNIYKVNVVLN